MVDDSDADDAVDGVGPEGQRQTIAAGNFEPAVSTNRQQALAVVAAELKIENIF
jgi:hypothetical protein